MTERSVVYKQPTEAIADGIPYRLNQVRLSMAVGVVVALLLGSKPLLNWTNQLPIGPVSDFLLYVAQGWQDTADGVGLTRFDDAIRYALRAFEGMR